ncbi:hypothetical protein SteCoe_11398 [Stentor coeruleus]|uniref:EF-hand domain-containing protein n=1 Tax=Stentor coeruleus TaxID=5963 RepID=A0A1R2CDB7_9CILI|nr:hypothetical protein SteCoe_11398 [Stentor coeruleus]
MGCSGSIVSTKVDRLPQPREEQIISNLETNLPFSHKTVRELVSTFRLSSFTETLTSSQLRKALEELSWTTYMQSKNNSLGKIISLITKNNKTPVITLCFMSILLGKASLEVKSEVLFTLIDTEAKGKIGVQTLRYALHALIMISIEILPQIAYDCQCLTFAEVQDYGTWLKRKKNGLINKILKEVCVGSNEISQSVFVEKIRGMEKYQRFLTANGIRTLLLTEELPAQIENSGISKIIVIRRKSLGNCDFESMSPRSCASEVGIRTRYMFDNDERRLNESMDISPEDTWQGKRLFEE